MDSIHIGKYFNKPLKVALSFLLVGFVFAFLAVGVGGASVIFIVLGFFTGLFTMFIYWLVLAFKSRNKTEMMGVPLVIVIIGFTTANGTLFNKECAVTNDFAVERIKNHLIEREKPIIHLGQPVLKAEKCEVWVEYIGNGDDITYIVSDCGKLHMDVRKGSAMN